MFFLQIKQIFNNITYKVIETQIHTKYNLITKNKKITWRAHSVEATNKLSYSATKIINLSVKKRLLLLTNPPSLGKRTYVH